MNITRQQQLLSLIKRIVSTNLRELNHEALHSAVVTHVNLSNDGRESRIWIDAPEAIVSDLNTRYHRDIQRAFMKQYMRKVVPRLIFLKDTGEIDRIDELLGADEQNKGDTDESE